MTEIAAIQATARLGLSCPICLTQADDEEQPLEVQPWACKTGHQFCMECIRTHIKSKLGDHLADIRCPLCVQQIESSEFATIFGEAEGQKLEKTRQMIQNELLRLCPQCDSLVLGDPKHPAMKCGNCQASFCFLHGSLCYLGMSQPGTDCEAPDISLFERIRVSLWTSIHTRKCPNCKHRIQKNGGSDHMTCRCGHEICWKCGGDYVIHGRHGHNKDLFPSPRNFKYCCNDWKMWTKRIAAAVVGAPVAVLAAAAAVVALPFLAAYAAFAVAVIVRAERARNF